MSCSYLSLTPKEQHQVFGSMCKPSNSFSQPERTPPTSWLVHVKYVKRIHIHHEISWVSLKIRNWSGDIAEVSSTIMQQLKLSWGKVFTLLENTLPIFSSCQQVHTYSCQKELTKFPRLLNPCGHALCKNKYANLHYKYLQKATAKSLINWFLHPMQCFRIFFNQNMLLIDTGM